MSSTIKASGKKYTIAVLGATGHLGMPLTTHLAKECKPSIFSRVVGLTRNPESDAAKTLEAAGVELYQIDYANPLESFTKAFKGIDVFLDLMPSSATDDSKSDMIEAVFKNHIKVFFVNEWGRDTTTDHWGWKFAPLARRLKFKEELIERAKSSHKKLIFIYPSFFLGMIFSSKFFGWDHENSVYSCYGSPQQRVSFTHEEDIARSVVELSCLALDPATRPSVPTTIRLCGDTVTVEEAARIVERVRGDGRKIEIKSEDYSAAKTAAEKGMLAGNHQVILSILRLSTADGEGDFSHRNNDELINPGQSLWKWKTIEEYARENKL